MSFAYTDPGANNKDAVRFLLQDTNPAEALLQDEEITWTITKQLPLHGTLEYVAATLAETIAARYAREANYSADGVTIGLGSVAQQYRDLAVQLRAQHRELLVGGLPDVGGVSPDEGVPFGVKPFAFGMGMHDDLQAGQQDYGGLDYWQYYYVAEEWPGYA